MGSGHSIPIGEGEVGPPRSGFVLRLCIRKAVVERGLTPGLIGLADAKAEDEAASRWAGCAVASGD